MAVKNLDTWNSSEVRGLLDSKGGFGQVLAELDAMPWSTVNSTATAVSCRLLAAAAKCQSLPCNASVLALSVATCL